MEATRLYEQRAMQLLVAKGGYATEVHDGRILATFPDAAPALR